MTLAALLGGVIMLGGIATLLWAYSLSVSTAGTNSDQYLRLLTGMLQVHDAGPLGDDASRLSAMRAALQWNATPRGVSSVFVDPSFSSVQNASRDSPSAGRVSAVGLQLSDWQRRRWAKLTQQQRSQRPPQQQQPEQPLEQQQLLLPPPPRPPPRPPPPPHAWDSSAKPRCMGDECAAAHERYAGEPMPLHKQAASGWLPRCTRTYKVPATLGKSESNFSYYKHLYCVVARYAAGANTAIDVGSALPPFINTFGWLGHRTILGPYFAGNVAKDGGGIHGERSLTLARIEAKYGVRAIEADFQLWPPSPALFDLVLCSEVVEHVAKAGPFVQKLLTLGAVVVLTVPYRWDKCDGCHHAHDDISLAQIAAWAGRKPFAYDVVEESDGDERIIVVFRSTAGRALQNKSDG